MGTLDWERARLRCVQEARRVLGDPADVEEATQEALLRAWRYGHRTQRRGAWLAWVGTIARNEALRLAARRTRAKAIESAHTAREPVLDDGALAHVLDADYVDRMLAPLTVAERTLLRMRYEEDLTQAQIATRLGVPEGTVKVRLHRLRQRLRDASYES
jgi:RNA polymerase sigma-70 factor, ECF subfamily